MGFPDIFLPKYLKEVLHKVQISAQEDCSGGTEFTHQSLLENRALLTDLSRARVGLRIHLSVFCLLVFSSLQIQQDLLLALVFPRILVIAIFIGLTASGKVSTSSSTFFVGCLTLVLSARTIWFSTDEAILALPPILRYYQTFASGVPVACFFFVGWVKTIPITMVSVMIAIGSFYSSLGLSEMGLELSVEKNLSLLVYGLVLQLSPIFVLKTYESEVEFYHSLLLKSLRSSEQKSKAKTTFISRMSHELRTPLQGLLCSSGLLKETKLTDDQMTYISIINSCGDLLLTIMEKILDITRIESGKFETQTQPFSLLGLVPSLLESVVGLSSAKGLDLLLSFDLTARSYVVHGDQKHLKGILTNLIGNAVKFTERGSVVVSVSVMAPRSDSWLPPSTMIYRFEVKDTGRGIPERVLPDLFEPFTKAYNYHESEGSGLGLSISKRFTEALGGVIGVETTVGVGSTFWAEIPFQVLDSNLIGPFLELPQFISTTVDTGRLPPIGVYARSELLGVIGGYLGSWGLRCEVVEDKNRLRDYAFIILEEKKLLEADGWTLPLPKNNSSYLFSSSPLSFSPDVFLNLLDSFNSSLYSSPPVFRKGMILTSLSSFHRMRIALQCSGYFDRVSAISEPLGPTSFRRGIIKMLGENSEDGDGHLFSEGSWQSRSRPVTPHLISTPVFSPAPAPLLGYEEKLDVLLVEDNPVNQAVMKKQFEKLKIKFAITGKAEDSIMIWEQYPLGITLVLMDIELDGPMSGLEATTIIRQKEMQSIGFAPGDAGSRHQQRVKSYIAIMTGRALEEDRREAFSCGCDDFLVKPVALEKMKDLISTLILDKSN